MKRYAEHHLERWFNKSRRKPLVIRGARQVGKSTLVRHFAQSQGLEIAEVNLERNRRLNDLFAAQNVSEIVQELEYITDTRLDSTHKVLLFLDEIQATPAAISALRYFFEDRPELPVIAAGSLLEFALASRSYTMPVGRIEYLYLGPMTFTEFLDAHDETKLRELIDSYSWGSRFPTSAHERLLTRLREYIVVGGMPEAVAVHVERGHLLEVADVHASIVETYQDDFAKYARQSQLVRMQAVFRHVPANAGNKTKYSSVDSESQARDVKAAIDLLAKAGVIVKVHHSSACGLPLGAAINPKVFKLYFLDIGLMNSICGVRHLGAAPVINDRFVNEGSVAEQLIAQHLLFWGPPNRSPELFYWLREARSRNAEVDFLVADSGGILPVEVKSGKSGTLRSLHYFVNKKDVSRALRFDLNTPSIQDVDCSVPGVKKRDGIKKFTLFSLPIYMVSRLDLCVD